MHNCEQTVYVDADACPVKEEVVNLCRKHKKKLVFVASYAHHLERNKDYSVVMVDSRAEEVDLYIVNHVKHGDIVVTQDHGLAAILLPKGIQVISPRGKPFENASMAELLFVRHLGQKQRRAGMKTKGPSKFTNEDILKFNEEFEKILSTKEGF